VGCGYYRGDGERAVDIAVSALPDARAAQAKAIALGGKTANPVDGVGDGGVARVTDDGAVLAVSRGRALVVVRINQRVSLEAVEIAKLVVAKL
jgi:acyl CoA:acetate/3-ketoacid CoA transferase beta subunit